MDVLFVSPALLTIANSFCSIVLKEMPALMESGEEQPTVLYPAYFDTDGFTSPCIRSCLVKDEGMKHQLHPWNPKAQQSPRTAKMMKELVGF